MPINGYHVCFKGKPETRRDAMFVSVDIGIQLIKQWEDGLPTLQIRGGAYSVSSIDAIEPSVIRGELDLMRAKRDGTYTTDEQLKQKMEALYSGGEVKQLS